MQLPEHYMTVVRANQIDSVKGHDHNHADGTITAHFTCGGYLEVTTAVYRPVEVGDWYIDFRGFTCVIPNNYFVKHFRPVTVMVDNATHKNRT